MRAWLGLESWQLGGVGTQAELWPSAPRWGAVKRRAVLTTKSTWRFLGLPRCAWDWSLLRGLESLCFWAAGWGQAEIETKCGWA